VSSDLSSKYVVIPAAGIGTRMKLDIPKQYIKLRNQKTILDTTISIFVNSSFFDKVIVALNKNDQFWQDSIYSNNSKVITCTGGDTRFESVRTALTAIKQFDCEKGSWVFVHDAARPALDLTNVTMLYEQVKVAQSQCGILAIRAFETVKKVSGSKITETLDRNDIWLAQTPQLAKLGRLDQAFEYCKNKGLTDKITDEASALELFDSGPIIVEGSKRNIKVTTKDDLDYIDWVFSN
jgi:2-C-methyl-D-erythritol 4-phosphate cytidylyltransferase